MKAFSVFYISYKDGEDTLFMKDEGDNEKLLIRYLLGNLPEEQRLLIEGDFLSDDQRYERLLALEDELFYDYAQNKLSPDDRKQFEKQFLKSERNRKRAMIASALALKMSESALVEKPEKSIADREPQRFWRSLKSNFVAQSAAMKVSLAALAIVSIALTFVIGIVRLRNEFNQLRAKRAVQEGQLRRQTQEERAQADELNLRLKRERDENAMLRQTLDKMQAQSGGHGQRAPSVISLVLAPSIISRGQAPGMKKLSLPPGAQLLKLQLKLEGDVEYKSFQVTLLTVEGAEIWSRDKLQAKGTGSSRSIDLWLPTRILAPGDYELRLKGYASDGTLEETGDYYYLSIRR